MIEFVICCLLTFRSHVSWMWVDDGCKCWSGECLALQALVSANSSDESTKRQHCCESRSCGNHQSSKYMYFAAYQQMNSYWSQPFAKKKQFCWDKLSLHKQASTRSALRWSALSTTCCSGDVGCLYHDVGWYAAAEAEGEKEKFNSCHHSRFPLLPPTACLEEKRCY